MLIQNTDALSRFLEPAIRATNPVSKLAIDTEFIGERTFRPRLCLIQVAIGDEIAAVDPLADIRLDPLWDVIRNPHITKIVHAGQQDARILHDWMGEPPAGIVDTQVAAALLGYGESIGLGKLVERMLQVTLDKGESLTDWSQRPLTDAQIEYALNDVRYLGAIHDRLGSDLQRLGRGGWLDEEHAVYQDPTFYTPDPERAYLRIKSVSRMRGREVAALKALAAWREHTAARLDRPRNRVASNDALVALSRRMPRTTGDMKRIRGTTPRFADEFGAEIVRELDAVRRLSDREFPSPPPRRDVPDSDVMLVDLLEVVLKSRAQDLEISPGVVATRKGLLALVNAFRSNDVDGRSDTGETLPVLAGWRGELLGLELLEVLRGNVSVSVEPTSGRVQIRDAEHGSKVEES
jgi:ribonuclease D